MSAIAGEHIQTAPAGVLTRARLKWLAYATLGGLIAIAGARYGYEWWRVGRFIESTDDAYVGGNVTAISPHVAGFVAEDPGRPTTSASKPGSCWSGSTSATTRRRWTTPTAVVDARERRRWTVCARSTTLQQSAIRQAGGRRSPPKPRRPTFAEQDASALPRPCTHRRRIAPGCANARSSLDQQARSAVTGRERRAWRPRSSSSRCWTREIAEAEAASGAGRRPNCRPRNSISATPRSARRSTAMSATARPRSAPMSRPARYLISVIPAHGLWVDANFKEDQLDAHGRRASAATVVADVAARPRVPRPCRQPGARHRRGVQRHPAGKRHRQFHQDRPARAGAHRARRRRRDAARMLRPGLSTTVARRHAAGRSDAP